LKLTALAKVDSKGRITIPQAIREALDIEPGMFVILIADLNRREITVAPIFTSSDYLYELEVELQDRPGALAKLTEALAAMGVDIVAARCASVARYETASCLIIVDTSRSNISEEALRKKLEELDIVTQVKTTKMRFRLD